MNSPTALFSTAYFPPLIYFKQMLRFESIFFEVYENYSKQSYRNRCEILSPNGIQILSIPVLKISGEKQLIKDVKIDYKTNWQALHLKSIKTAYLSSPFFEYYIDSLLPYFKKKTQFLIDYNYQITNTLLTELQIKKKLKLTERFSLHSEHTDFRNSIHPKIRFSEEELNKFKPYTQVFFDKFNFIPNLSILDLLFNEGPDSECFLIS
jgi:hypothetical protein